MFILLDALTVTHNDLRNRDSIPGMVRYVQQGGFFTTEKLREFAVDNGLPRASPLIQIVRFEDGVAYIHDGHHRVVSCHLAGRTYLRDDECETADWLYDQYQQISHENGWYTPFDPRVHCRASDFYKFKREARHRFHHCDNPDDVLDWISNNPHLYRLKRMVATVDELCTRIQEQST